MALKKKEETGNEPITVQAIRMGAFDVAILGLTPIILHHGSVKTHLVPPRKLSKVERDMTLKHEPFEEYRDRMILAPDGGPTKLLFPAAAFKGGMMTAALRIGVVKTEIAQLTMVEGSHVELYGVPQIFIREVRMADMARTPDARTSPIIEKWACQLTVSYVEPMMTAQAVANLLHAAGRIAGVGDWRPEKGKGTYGQFEIVEKTDPRYLAIVQSGGADAQKKAIAEPTAYDALTLDALNFYHAEMEARKNAGRAQVSRRKKPNGSEAVVVPPSTM